MPKRPAVLIAGREAVTRLNNFMIKRTRKHSTSMLLALSCCLAFVVQCHDASYCSEVSDKAASVQLVANKPAAEQAADPMEQLAQTDPIAFFEKCLENYDRNVKDYKVTFAKQEKIGHKVSEEQITEVRFREEPYSVDMRWVHNAGRASRLLYVEGQRVDKHGNEMALIKPSGVWGGLGIKVERDIHGRDAKREGRRTIDQFGFRNTLGFLIHYSSKARNSGELVLKYIGQGRVDERPTYVFERLLPYNGDDSLYPDRLLRVHIDKEWLVPTVCLSYEDEDGKALLGSYILTGAQFNIGYTDADFDPDNIDF